MYYKLLLRRHSYMNISRTITEKVGLRFPGKSRISVVSLPWTSAKYHPNRISLDVGLLGFSGTNSDVGQPTYFNTGRSVNCMAVFKWNCRVANGILRTDAWTDAIYLVCMCTCTGVTVTRPKWPCSVWRRKKLDLRVSRSE